MIDDGKRTTTTIAVNEEDRARATRLIEAGLADTFSQAVRVGLALAVRVIEQISATMKIAP